ncbi:MAG: ATP-binding protein [Gammaproteobacteria bacterium]|nr:ATP-binding protein [Gammaproteobacteria bacterium]
MADRLIKSSVFRLALLYMIIFGASVAMLLVFIYWSTAGYMARQTDDTIGAEITGLAERYRISGLEGLVRSIEERLSRRPNGSAIYLLANRDLEPVVGNLASWPRVEVDADGWLNFSLEQATARGELTHRARARPFTLRGGYHLLVGRDMHELDATRNLIARALAWGLAITVLLGLVGGVTLSRRTLRRLEAINETSRRIMRGDLSQRIPKRGTGDDYDQLAENLNGMLDVIERLMEDVRRVSDNIAHDLRTPLTRLRHRLETLKHMPDADHGALEAALADADGLLSTFNALLRIANIESGRRVAAFQDLALDAVVGDVAELYEPLAEARGLTLESGGETNINVRGDRDLLFQAVANLLDNAIKYTPAGGHVRVSTRLHGDKARLVVRDDGPGIPESARDKVFRRFFRLEQSRNTPGNGLGLSLVEAVARLHGATIRLADGDPGLEVTLDFPAAATQPAPPPAKDAA